MSDFKNFMSSERGRKTLYALGALFLAILIFHAGVAVGSHRHVRGKSEMEHGWGFRGPGFDVKFPRGFIAGSHGAVGIIVSVGSSSITLRTRDGETQTVLLTNTTVTRSESGDASSTTLSVGQHIIILGSPSDAGALTADLIRILPDTFPKREKKRY